MLKLSKTAFLGVHSPAHLRAFEDAGLERDLKSCIQHHH